MVVLAQLCRIMWVNVPPWTHLQANVSKSYAFSWAGIWALTSQTTTLFAAAICDEGVILTFFSFPSYQYLGLYGVLGSSTKLTVVVSQCCFHFHKTISMIARSLSWHCSKSRSESLLPCRREQANCRSGAWNSPSINSPKWSFLPICRDFSNINTI